MKLEAQEKNKKIKMPRTAQKRGRSTTRLESDMTELGVEMSGQQKVRDKKCDRFLVRFLQMISITTGMKCL